MDTEKMPTGFSEEQVNFELAAITKYREELNATGGSLENMLAAYARISNAVLSKSKEISDEQAYYDFQVDVAYEHLLEYLIVERSLKDNGYVFDQSNETSRWVRK